MLVSHRITLEIKKKYCFVDKVDDCTKFAIFLYSTRFLKKDPIR